MLEKNDLEMIAEIVKDLVQPISEDMNSLKKDVREVQLTLENETNQNIKIIAEGHLNLSRKLDSALKVKKEMLLIRVTNLENEVRGLKAKNEETA